MRRNKRLERLVRRHQKRIERAEKRQQSLVMPPLVLTVVCLIVTAALVLTYQFTAPFIAEAKALAADRSRSEVFAQADSFLPYAGALPEDCSVYLAYQAGELLGCVVSSSSQGFSGAVVVMSAHGLDGSLVGVKITEHSETPGLGSKVAESKYLVNYGGLDATGYLEIDAVSGATITSNALKVALAQAFAAAEQVLEEVAQ